MKIPMFKKFRQIAHEKSGMTLVELIVAFALIGIFMVAATFMLGTSFQLFGRMQSSSQAVTVSDLILDKIVGEIAAADLPKKGDAGYYFWLESEKKSPWLAFCNRSGSPVAIYADDDGDRSNGSGKGSLFIKYYGMGEDGKKATSEMDWRFDRRVYMGYKITSLNFSRKASEHPNVVRIDLTLEHEQSGATYSTFRYAENYNFDVNSNYMCTRNDGNTGMPVQAKEFEIKAEPAPEPEPEPNTTKYIVEHHVGGRVITEEFFAENGSTVFLYPKTAVKDPRFEGYQAVEGRYQFIIEKDVVNTYVFNYKGIEADMVEYRVQHHRGRGEVFAEEAFYGKVGSTVVLYPKDSSVFGFEGMQVIRESDSITDSITVVLESGQVRTYIFLYEAISKEEVEYTIRHQRKSDGQLLEEETFTAYLGTRITAKAKEYSESPKPQNPQFKGYKATESSKTLMITADKNLCVFEYVPAAEYTILHQRQSDGSTLMKETGTAAVGTQIMAKAKEYSESPKPQNPQFKGYKATESSKTLMITSSANVCVFEYVPTAEYTILHQRQSDGYIFMKETGTAAIGAEIVVNAKNSSDPLFKGYVATESSKTLMITSPVGEKANVCEFYYVPTKTGEREYLIRCEVSPSSYGILDPLKFVEGQGVHDGDVKLYQENRFHSSAGGEFVPPPIPRYTPTISTYKVTPFTGSTIVVPYIPNTVKLRVYAKYGEKILEETVLDVKYNSIVSLNNLKLKIGGYTSQIAKPLTKPHAQLKIDQLTDMEYTFYYK